MQTKVTAIVDDEEFCVGVFNQGVVFDFDKDMSLAVATTLRDVATGDAIARIGNYGGTWQICWKKEDAPEGRMRTGKPMGKLFIQAID